MIWEMKALFRRSKIIVIFGELFEVIVKSNVGSGCHCRSNKQFRKKFLIIYRFLFQHFLDKLKTLNFSQDFDLKPQ